MSIESLNADLAALERDVRALVKDAGASQTVATQTVAERVKTVADEAVAAEFIATEEAIENVSGILATLSRIGEIQTEQLRTLLADHRATFQALLQIKSPFDLARLGFDHWNRRATHIADGLTRTVEAVSRETSHATHSVAEMWKPFVDLVRGDWLRR